MSGHAIAERLRRAAREGSNSGLLLLAADELDRLAREVDRTQEQRADALEKATRRRREAGDGNRARARKLAAGLGPNIGRRELVRVLRSRLGLSDSQARRLAASVARDEGRG